ncbi:hypothetical protein GGR20_000461 [Devosia subaequoris]|uniref:Porin n=1 Tax=Devosia subaequoris TaxID=395930 RepID=A0A7W6IJP1_9HYPH|nr:hypothetical protein [Devosia subaequoris]MBB4050843.1 hypothetical protein [Devosia subaequoris]MCP1208480.1 hypothetical protein [Devosia subaequoris]
MKLKSLILGSVAAAGLSTAGFAADLGVLTSLDVCDSLGISGLTISSADNCLQITGEVKYEFNWGDYNGTFPGMGTATHAGTRNVMDNDSVTVNGVVYDNDWSSDVDSWLKFVGTASSDFGPASATIKIKNEHKVTVVNEGYAVPAAGGAAVYTAPAAANANVVIDEAYVSIGDTTVIMAGKKGSVANFGDDEPFNFLGLFNSDAVDKGVMFAKDLPYDGGHVIQVVSDLGNGVVVKGGLENLDSNATAAFGVGGYYDAVAGAQNAGTLVGVVEYAGDGITAHVTGMAGGILDGIVENWAVHAGVTGTFDMFKVRAAGAYSANNANDTHWNVLASAEATFDMFKIALSGEAAGGQNAGVAVATQTGIGGSIGATVTEGVSINLGGKWFDEDNNVANNESYQVAAQLVAAVSETIKITGEIGVYGTNKAAAVATAGQTDFYGAAELAWAPGGGFTSSVKGEVHQNGAYKVTFKAAKAFQ